MCGKQQGRLQRHGFSAAGIQFDQCQRPFVIRARGYTPASVSCTWRPLAARNSGVIAEAPVAQRRTRKRFHGVVRQEFAQYWRKRSPEQTIVAPRPRLHRKRPITPTTCSSFSPDVVASANSAAALGSTKLSTEPQLGALIDVSV